jgi:hydrogenase nickel incorporation protein HypA/HybF
MHELSVASSIANNVMDFARKHNAKKVLEVKLAIGELTSLATEQLTFCYEAVCRETLIEGSNLEIEKIQAEISCSHCSYKGAPKMWAGAFHSIEVPTLQCPECGKGADAVKGKECTIKNIKYVD